MGKSELNSPEQKIAEMAGRLSEADLAFLAGVEEESEYENGGRAAHVGQCRTVHAQSELDYEQPVKHDVEDGRCEGRYHVVSRLARRHIEE